MSPNLAPYFYWLHRLQPEPESESMTIQPKHAGGALLILAGVLGSILFLDLGLSGNGTLSAEPSSGIQNAASATQGTAIAATQGHGDAETRGTSTESGSDRVTAPGKKVSPEQASAFNAKQQAEIDRGLILVLLESWARAISELPRTRDTATVMQYYAPEAIEIQDGRISRYKDLAKRYADRVDAYTLDQLGGVLVKIDGADIQIAGTQATAIYASSYQTARYGLPESYFRGICSAVFEKRGGKWLVTQEHCSEVR